MKNDIHDKDHMKSRRSMIKSVFATVLAAGTGALGIARANQPAEKPVKRVSNDFVSTGNRQPLISQFTTHGDFVFVKGMGDHDERDISKATSNVLDMIEEQLDNAGSSMDKALQVTVFLHNLRDYDAMNEAYRGRFGDSPPARTTVACYNGIPGGSLLEIDCIAAL